MRYPTTRDSGKWPSAVLTVLVHGLLAAFLFYGIHWQARPPAVVEVSLVPTIPAPQVQEPTRPEPQPVPEPQPEPPPSPEPEPPPPPAPPPTPNTPRTPS